MGIVGPEVVAASGDKSLPLKNTPDLFFKGSVTGARKTPRKGKVQHITREVGEMSEKTMAFILVVSVLVSMVLLIALGRVQEEVGVAISSAVTFSCLRFFLPTPPRKGL